MKKSLCILFIALLALLCYCLYCIGGNETFAKKSLEFEVICPNDARIGLGIGICLAEHEGREIIVCCFLGARKKYLLQAYDMVGNQLQIPENILVEKASDMLNANRVGYDFYVKASKDSEELTMYREWDDSGRHLDKNDSACIVWRRNFSDYTDFDEKWADILEHAWVHSLHFRIRPLSSLDNLSSAVVPLVAQCYQYMQIWGVSCENGEEKFTVSTRLEDVSIHELYFNSSLQHTVAGLEHQTGVLDSYSFFQTRDDFSANTPLMDYRLQPITFNTEGYFVTDDVFCFGGRHNSFLSQEFYAVIYSFSKNKVIAKIRLGSFLSMHCEPWGFPWCAISKDGKKLVLGYLRSARLSSSDFKNFIRVYELEK